MATQKIDDTIGQDVITIDNINSYAKISSDAVDSIESDDIPTFEQHIRDLSKVYNKQKRVISESEPADPLKGSVWFVVQSQGSVQPQTEQILE